MFDESGSMTDESKLEKFRKALEDAGGTDMSASLKAILANSRNKDGAKLDPIILMGTPAVGKSAHIKKMAELLHTSNHDSPDKVIVFDSTNYKDDKLGDLLKDIRTNPHPAGFDPNAISNNFNFFSPRKPLTPDEVRSVAEIHMSKTGVEGALRDIISEIIDERIAKDGNKFSAGDAFDLIDDLKADPDHPALVEKRMQRAYIRQQAASKTEGTVMADTMRQGVKATLRPMRPVRFK